MWKFNNLVAEREVCERIPHGYFEDTAFAWFLTEVTGFVCHASSGCEAVNGKQWQLVRNSKAKLDMARAAGEMMFPAPTLEEVMAAMPYCRVYKKTSGFFISVKDESRHPSFRASTSALKLWLEMHWRDQ